MRHLNSGDHARWDTVQIGDQKVVAVISQEPVRGLRPRPTVEQGLSRLNIFALPDAAYFHPI